MPLPSPLSTEIGNAINPPSSLAGGRSRFVAGTSSLTLSLAKIAFVLTANIPRLIHGRPTAELEPRHHSNLPKHHDGHHGYESKDHGGNRPFNLDYFAQGEDQQSAWLYASIAVALVLAGGVFAGLTLGLMGQDEIYLQVIEQSGESTERMHARRVLRLLKKGKHWVLVTLLLSNVITNETLPIVLDRGLGGGWPAVVSSTVLIVIFGEIIPQSVCVRYGLAIGSYLSPCVIALMYLMYPIAYPTALLLDWILGEDHGTVYKKAGLKTLVTLHKTLGPSPSERLNQDEVTIISAVLDLKDKPVGSIMTPVEDVFTMSSEDVLDEGTMNRILSAGYSRIPIHAPGEPTNFVGMLLVKILITYDPEDAMRVKDFPLATLPETAPDTSCLDIVNFFQEGKSHMVLVSSHPGENHGALGVVTLEDVIEELIGEEIIDESDVFIDVHKAIRRIHPSPLARRSITSTHPRTVDSAIAANTAIAAAGGIDLNSKDYPRPQGGTSSEAEENASGRKNSTQVPSQTFPPDVMQHLKHLEPSNLASNPKKTAFKSVKIKQGNNDDLNKLNVEPLRPLTRTSSNASATYNPFANLAASGQQTESSGSRPTSGYGAVSGDRMIDSVTRTRGSTSSPALISFEEPKPSSLRHISTTDPSPPSQPDGNPQKYQNYVPYLKKGARSGSLVESVKHTGGMPKTVIETTSSEEDEENEQREGSTYWAGSKSNGRRSIESSNGRENEDESGKGDKETSPLLRVWGIK